jgi:hypothetical protein
MLIPTETREDTVVRRGLFGWVSRKPKTAFWTTLAAAFVVGAGIGAAGADQSDKLNATKSQLADAQSRAHHLTSSLSDERATSHHLQDDLDTAKAKIKRLTAKGDVPRLTGGSESDARLDDLVVDLGWHVRTTSQPSDAEPGTVIAQQPSEGVTLKRGKTITLTVAVPRPKAWKTIASFSGSGSKRTDEFRIPRGVKTRISYSYSGETNAILEIKKPGDGEFGGDLLLNEIGNYSDTTRLYDKRGKYYLDIEGGSWTVSVQAFE